MTHDIKLAENAAALSAVFHQHPRFREAYRAIQDDVSGFPGIWTMLGKIAQRVTAAEECSHLNFSNVSWIEFTDNLVNLLIEDCIGNEQVPHPGAVDSMIEEARRSV